MQIDGSNHPWLEGPGNEADAAHRRGRRHRDRGPGRFPHQRGHPRLPGALGGTGPAVGNPLALYSDRHAALKYNARQKPVPVETTQFARVMRELGVQQIFALSPQAKGRVERMLETFQDRLVTELRLARASSIDEAGLVLPGVSAPVQCAFRRGGGAAGGGLPAGPGRAVPDRDHLSQGHPEGDPGQHGEVPLAGLQLLPGAERPSYAGLRVEVLERADGELLLQYQGEAVDFQDGPPPSSVLWGADTGCSPDPEQQEGADGVVNSHLNEAHGNAWPPLNRQNRPTTRPTTKT